METFFPNAGRIVFREHVREVVRAHGLEYAYAKPGVCSPLPYALSHARVLRKPACVEHRDAVRQSVCVNAFWSSTANFDTTSTISADRVSKAGSQGSVIADSVWAFVLEEAGRVPTRSDVQEARLVARPTHRMWRKASLKRKPPRQKTTCPSCGAQGVNLNRHLRNVHKKDGKRHLRPLGKPKTR